MTMKTVFNVLCKGGRELEATYTTRLQADAHIFTADPYMATIEPEEYTDADFQYLEQQEKEYTDRCEQWGELTDVELYQIDNFPIQAL
jgi:hypothetical protein